MPTLISKIAEKFTVDALCITCVSVAGLFSFAIPAISDVATAILVFIGVGFLVRSPKTYGVSAPLILGVIWIGFVLASAAYATAIELPGHHFRGLEKHLPIALGPLVAIAIGRSCDRLKISKEIVLVLFSCALIAGGLISLLSNGAIDFFWDGWRYSDGHSFIGHMNRNFAAFICGISLVLSAALLEYFVGRRLVMVALALVVIFEGEMLISLQSRTAYVSAALALLTWAGIRIWNGWKLPLALFSLIAALAATQSHSIAERLTTRGDRPHIVSLGIELITQRPWFGWGPDSSQLLKLFSSVPEIQALTQFHNAYLQTIVSFGLVGAALMLCLLLSLAWSAFQEEAQFPPSLLTGIVALLVYIAVTSSTESIIFVKPAAMVCMMLAALVCVRVPRPS